MPEKDIRIDVVGLRPGEKLYEELLMDEEGIQDTPHKRIKVGQPIEIAEDFEDKLKGLIAEAYVNGEGVRNTLMEICPTYKPQRN